MKNVRLMGLAAALVAAGCGGGSSIDVTEEPAGPNCPTGGFRIEADGQVFYSCDGGVIVEDVAAGEDGNTCLGGAVRVTFPADSGTPRVVYVCDAPGEADPDDVASLAAPNDLLLARTVVECACTASDQEVTSCEHAETLYSSLSRVLNSCIHQVLVLAGPPPASFDDSAGCYFGAQREVTECILALELPTECTVESETALLTASEQCQVMFGNPDCEEADTEMQLWQLRYDTLAELADCPPMFGATVLTR